MAVLKMNFLSEALGMQTNVTICLPTFSFADSFNGGTSVYIPGMKYQVMYLLHGGSGDDSDYVNFSNIVRYADDNKIAVIMPCGYNSCYTDSPDGAPRYYTYITEELPKVMETLFPISTAREDTFVAGLSMGSHGAMKVAINNPEKFAAALIMSGASYRPGVPRMVPCENGVFNLEAASIKPPMSMGSISDRIEDPEFIKGTVNDVYTVAQQNVDEGKQLPKLFFRVGNCDTALYRAIQAEKELREMGYETELEIVPGMHHEWDLWDDTLRFALREWLPLKHSIIYP